MPLLASAAGAGGGAGPVVSAGAAPEVSPPAAAPAPVAPFAAGAASPAPSFGAGESERGVGSLGVRPFMISAPTLLSPAAARPVIALLAACTTSVALKGLGSTRVGSPTFVASATLGWRVKLPIRCPNIPTLRRLSSSFWFCATAACCLRNGLMQSLQTLLRVLGTLHYRITCEDLVIGCRSVLGEGLDRLCLVG